jgi:hypothetical protein
MRDGLLLDAKIEPFHDGVMLRTRLVCLRPGVPVGSHSSLRASRSPRNSPQTQPHFEHGVFGYRIWSGSTSIHVIDSPVLPVSQRI